MYDIPGVKSPLPYLQHIGNKYKVFDKTEKIHCWLNRVPSKYNSIAIAITIYHAKDRHQSFSKVKNVFINIKDCLTNQDFCKFNSGAIRNSNEAKTFIIGQLANRNGIWKFEPIAESTKDSSIVETIQNNFSPWRYEN